MTEESGNEFNLTHLLNKEINKLHNEINSLESRIETEIRFTKMAHDLCNVFQCEKDDLRKENEELKKQLVKFNEGKVL